MTQKYLEDCPATIAEAWANLATNIPEGAPKAIICMMEAAFLQGATAAVGVALNTGAMDINRESLKLGLEVTEIAGRLRELQASAFAEILKVTAQSRS
jgi:hypothetical protein